jgi:ankyrin repeat protein
MVSRYGSSLFIRMLLLHGADINHRDWVSDFLLVKLSADGAHFSCSQAGHNSLYHAVNASKWDNVELLLKHGITVSSRSLSLCLSLCHSLPPSVTLDLPVPL